MENNVIQSTKFNEKRPNKRARYTESEINSKINNETKLAKHYLWLYCIKNSLWLIPLTLVVVIGIFVDLWVVFFIWKNPVVLFKQLRILASWIIAFILGLYFDDIKHRIVKH